MYSRSLDYRKHSKSTRRQFLTTPAIAVLGLIQSYNAGFDYNLLGDALGVEFVYWLNLSFKGKRYG